MRALVVVIAFSVSTSTVAGDSAVIDDLRRQLRERDEEIARLRRQLKIEPRTSPPQSRLQGPARLSLTYELADAESGLLSRVGPLLTREASDEELGSALDSALVRQGGRVLARGVMEIEPELSYIYDDLTGNRRRDHFSIAATARIGLPWSLQAEIRVPYVIHDRISDAGSSSGVGDVRIGLTKELLREQRNLPALLASVAWRLKTGDINRMPAPTGFGQHALQYSITAVKRADPTVVFGSLFYTQNLGSADLGTGAQLRAGDTLGGRLGLYLAATPDTSLYYAVALNSLESDRLNGQPLLPTSRLNGVLEIGATTTLGRARFLSITGGFGFTSAAPKFSTTVALPVRF